MFSRLISLTVPPGGSPTQPLRHVELSVYAVSTGEETPLGENYLYGPCAGIPGSYVCPGQEGFLHYH